MEICDPFPLDALFLVDTGTLGTLVALGIAAADAVVVPMMLSPQTIRPTVSTLALVERLEKPLAGLVLVGVGSAQWEGDLLAGWRRAVTGPPAGARAVGGLRVPRKIFSYRAGLAQILFGEIPMSEKPHAAP